MHAVSMMSNDKFLEAFVAWANHATLVWSSRRAFQNTRGACTTVILVFTVPFCTRAYRNNSLFGQICPGNIP